MKRFAQTVRQIMQPRHVGLFAVVLVLSTTGLAQAQQGSASWPAEQSRRGSAGEQQSAPDTVAPDDVWQQALDQAAGVPDEDKARLIEKQKAVAAEQQSAQQAMPATASAPEKAADGTEFSADTLLRAGDVLKVHFPGESSLNKTFAIDRFGRLDLPEYGLLPVSGQTITEAEAAIRRALQSYFRDVEVLRLFIAERRLLVKVSGQVANPGLYDLARDATVEAAIVAAGGMKAGAQLDRLTVIRDKQRIKVNYRSFLDTGDAALLPRLQSLDEVFVPISSLAKAVEVEFDSELLEGSDAAEEPQDTVSVFGEVHRPGRFAFKDEQSLLDYLLRAGGPTMYAGVETIRVLSPDGTAVRFDLTGYLDSADKSRMPSVSSGTTVFVPRAQESVKRSPTTVYVMGEVNSPGSYEMGNDLTFMDLLANAGGPTRYAETRQIRVIRADGSIAKFDLVGFTEGIGEQIIPEIGPSDAIFVPEKADQVQPSWLKVPPEKAIHLMGAVTTPDRYEWSDEMTLLDLLAHGGGPTKRADVAHITIVPGGPDTGKTPIIFNLDAYQKDPGTHPLPQLKSQYMVMVPQLPDDPHDNKAQWLRQAPEASIYIIGAVNSPGRYAFNEQMGFLDILSAADGPLNSADLRNVQITHRDRSVDRVETFSMIRYLESGDDATLPDVRNGDVIFIPHERGLFRGVNILGAVNSPGRYEWAQNMTVLELLAAASGPNHRGDLSAVVVSPSPERADQTPSRVFDIEAYLRNGEGRVPLLNKGDTVLISELPDDPTDNKSQWVRQPSTSSIYIMGEVNAPGRYLFTKQLGFLDILGAADGPTKQADLSRIFIVHRGKSGLGVSQFDFRSYIESGREGALPTVAPEDVIFLVPREGPERKIGIVGEVLRPGQYEWRPGMTLVELIEEAGGPKDNGDIANIRITPGGIDKGQQSLRFNLQEYYDSGDLLGQPELKLGYSVYVPPLPDDDDDDDNKSSWIKLAGENAVYVLGEVGNPGRFAFNDSMNFLDILSAAEGPTGRADLHNIRITSRNDATAKVSGINLALYLETGDEHLLPRVRTGDVIYVPTRDRQWLDDSKETTVRVLGAVRDPGRYRFDDSMTILDLIAEAGGPNGNADVHRIAVINLSCCEDRARSFDLARFASTGDFGALPLLRQGDTIYVPYYEEAPIDKFARRTSGFMPILTLLLLLL